MIKKKKKKNRKKRKDMADARKTLYCFWEKRYSGIAGSFSFLFFSFIFILFIFFFRGEGG